jgi:hypothetical protein
LALNRSCAAAGPDGVGQPMRGGHAGAEPCRRGQDARARRQETQQAGRRLRHLEGQAGARRLFLHRPRPGLGL